MSDYKSKLNKIASSFSMKTGFNGFLVQYRIRKVLELAKYNDSLLDLGCADGIFANSIYPFFKSVEAIDGSEVLIKRARAEKTPVNFHCSLIEDFNPKREYETIVLSFILEHVTDVQQVLRKAKSFMRKERSEMIILVPNANSLHRQLGLSLNIISQTTELTPQDIEHGHQRIFTIDSLITEIKKAGLTMTNLEPYFIKPFSNKQMEIYDKKICDGLYELSRKFPEISAEIAVRCVL